MNTINVSACDNELYIVAVLLKSSKESTDNLSNQLCHIQSGGNNKVAVKIDIEVGNYEQYPTYNGVTKPLNIHSKVKLPKGVYNILAVAIDWGGGRNIGVKINSGKLFGTDGYKSGPFDVGVYQVNEGKVLGKITVK
tara:strand:+ start:108 stop:518 length:411 start_codon:yes stop_codon:yes gene_type:complete